MDDLRVPLFVGTPGIFTIDSSNLKTVRTFIAIGNLTIEMIWGTWLKHLEGFCSTQEVLLHAYFKPRPLPYYQCWSFDNACGTSSPTMALYIPWSLEAFIPWFSHLDQCKPCELLTPWMEDQPPSHDEFWWCESFPLVELKSLQCPCHTGMAVSP